MLYGKFRAPAQLRRKREKVQNALTALMSGAVVFLFVIFVFSVIITKIDLSESVVRAMSTVALCAGCFTASFKAANSKRKSGLLTGLLCGAVVYAAVFLVSAVILDKLGSAGAWSKILLIIICSVAGGIVGVNTKRK